MQDSLLIIRPKEGLFFFYQAILQGKVAFKEVHLSLSKGG